MMHKHCADVVIVGAGLVGSALAASIAQQAPNLQVLLLEAKARAPQWHNDKFDPRVVALAGASVEMLHSLGVWTRITAQRACPYRAMEVWDGEGNGRIHFDCSEVHRQQLGFIVENSAALVALRQTLAELPNVQILPATTLTAWQQVAERNHLQTSDGRDIIAPLLIGADGAHSQLRQWAGLQTREWDYGHHAIITTVKTEKAHDYVARQRFSHEGPLALLPLCEQDDSQPAHHSSIVWSLKPEFAEQMMALDDAQFCQQLGRTFEHRLGDVLEADQRFSVPLRQRHVNDYGRAGFALVGDAAHTIHPLAGQGVNLGLYDARALAAEVARAAKRAVPLHHASVVQRYQRARKMHNLMAMSSMEGFKRLFGAQGKAVFLARNRGMSAIDHMPWLKRQLITIAAGG